MNEPQGPQIVHQTETGDCMYIRPWPLGGQYITQWHEFAEWQDELKTSDGAITALAAHWLGLSVDEANMLRQRRVLQQKGEGQS